MSKLIIDLATLEADDVKTVLTIAGVELGEEKQAKTKKETKPTKTKSETTPRKTTKAAAKKDKAKEEPEAEAAEESQEEEQQEEMSVEEAKEKFAGLKSAVRAYAKENGREAVEEILEEYGIDKLSALKPEKYDDFLSSLV